MGLQYKTKRQLKKLNEIRDKEMKIRYLMDILERKNQEIVFLRRRLWDLTKGQ